MSADRARMPTGSAAPAAPAPDRSDRPRRHLRPIRPPSRRRSPGVPMLVGAGIVIAALFALAAAHALLIDRQLRLDEVQRAVASETEQVHRLRLQVAELESPDRILEVARERLGMVEAPEVGYLLPAGIDSGDHAPVRVEAAEAPSRDATHDEARDEDPDAMSPEQQAVEASMAGVGPSGWDGE